jgi:hypothetical protein
MKYKYFLGIIILIVFTTTVYPQAAKQIQGVWKSYNRIDTMTFIFNDSLAYFISPSIKTLDQNVFSFFIYNLSGQFIIQLMSPDQKSEARLRLWFVDEKEIKVQSIDPVDFNNPQKNVPKESNENTFYLKKQVFLHQ